MLLGGVPAMRDKGLGSRLQTVLVIPLPPPKGELGYPIIRTCGVCLFAETEG